MTNPTYFAYPDLPNGNEVDISQSAEGLQFHLFQPFPLLSQAELLHEHLSTPLLAIQSLVSLQAVQQGATEFGIACNSWWEALRIDDAAVEFLGQRPTSLAIFEGQS